MFKKRKSMKLQMFGRCNNSASAYVVKEDKSSIVPDKVRRRERRTCASFGSVFLDSATEKAFSREKELHCAVALCAASVELCLSRSPFLSPPLLHVLCVEHGNSKQMGKVHFKVREIQSRNRTQCVP